MAVNAKSDGSVNLTGLLVACCAAGAAKSIEPPLYIFYPPGRELFNAGWTDLRFLASVSAILMVVFLLAGGLLGDVYGRRRLLLIGLAVSVVANASLLFASTGGWHILLRAVAIMAGAFVLPLALASIYVFYQGRQQSTALAAYILATTVATLLAARQGRTLMAATNWRAAYLVPLSVGLIALALAWKYVPEQRAAGKRHIQAIGRTGWTLVVLAILFGLLQATVASEWLAIILGAAIMVLLIGLIVVSWWGLRMPQAALPNPTVRTRDVTALIVTGVIIQLLLMGVYLPTYDLLHVVEGRNVWSTLLALTPLLLGMLGSLFLINRFLHARRVGRTLALGLACVAIAILLLGIQPMIGGPALQSVALFLFGLAVLATKTVWTNGLFQTVVDDYVGANAAMHGASVQIGGAVGAVLGTQLLVRFGRAAMEDQWSVRRMGPEEVARLAGQLRLLLVQRIPLDLDPAGELLLEGYRAAFASGYARTLWVLAGLALLAAFVIAVGVRRSLRYRNRVAVSAMLD